MSAEQWGLLALFVLLPLLEAVARFRQARASNGNAVDGVGPVRNPQRRSSIPNRDVDRPVVPAAKPREVSPPPSLPPPLPPPAPPPVTSLSRASASRMPYRASVSIPALTRTGNSVPRDPGGRWLRPVRNLRHAIIVATILAELAPRHHAVHPGEHHER